MSFVNGTIQPIWFMDALFIHSVNRHESPCAHIHPVYAQETTDRVSSTAGAKASRSPLATALFSSDPKYDKFLQPTNKSFGSVCGKIFDGPWSGFSGPLSPSSEFNVDDLFGSSTSDVSEKKSLITSTINETAAAAKREHSIFNFASATESEQRYSRNHNPDRAPPPQPAVTTYDPFKNGTIKLRASSGYYTPTCTSNPGSLASFSFGFSEESTKPQKTILNKMLSQSGHKSFASKQTGDGPTDYNPLLMRGPGASIFRGTCKWYNSQRGFGFIIPVRISFLLTCCFFPIVLRMAYHAHWHRRDFVFYSLSRKFQLWMRNLEIRFVFVLIFHFPTVLQ